MRLFSFSLIIIILISGLLAPKFKEFQTGPSAVSYWRDKDKKRMKSQAEVEEFMIGLDRKINEYINQNPQLSEKIKEELKVFHTVHVGMIKEQVLLLVEEPSKREFASEYGADEKWIYITYHPYAEDHLYFKGDIVIKILGFQTGNVL